MLQEQKLNYREYIKSPEWRGKHKGWLKASNYRCSMFPWLQVGKGKPYNCHHMIYNLGEEKLWEHVIVVHPFVHKHIIHGILSGYKRPSQQKGGYPNNLQKLAHLWCCTPHNLKAIIPLALLIIIGGLITLIT
jgi:hypothetical protein